MEIAPKIEVALRRDAGDAETGTGVDAAAGIDWSHAASGWSGSLHARKLMTHDADAFDERSLAGEIKWDGTPSSELGLSARLSHRAGAQASGGMEALLEQGGNRWVHGTGAEADAATELRMGYGLPAFSATMVATPEIGVRLGDHDRRYSVGWRLDTRREKGETLTMRIGVDRVDAKDGQESTSEIRLTVGARW